MLAGILGLASAQILKVQKKETGSSKSGWLGVSIQDITSEMKKAMELKSREGALVSDVVKKSPADSAGIREKDVIVQFGERLFPMRQNFRKQLPIRNPGRKCRLL